MALTVLAASIVIMTSFFYDISRAYGVRSPCSHYDVILIVTPFAHRYSRTDTLPCLMYKDVPVQMSFTNSSYSISVISSHVVRLCVSQWCVRC